MATFFKNTVIKEVGTIPVRILETTPTTRATVIGLSLANLSGSIISASIMVQDDTSVTGYYLKDVIIPPQSTLKAVNGGEKLILAPSNQLYVSSNISESIDVVCTYVEIV